MAKIVSIGLSDLKDEKVVEIIDAISEETGGNYNLEGSHEVWVQLRITDEEVTAS